MDRSNPDFVEELRQARTTEEFEAFLKRHDSEMKLESFGDVVLRLCDERGIAASVVQTRIAISKSQFYYVINGTRNPSKEVEKIDELLREYNSKLRLKDKE